MMVRLQTLLAGIVLIGAICVVDDIERFAKNWAIQHGYAYLWRGR